MLLKVDGIDIEYLPTKEIHALIGGRVHSIVELTLERRSTAQIYVVHAKRHKRHELEEVLTAPTPDSPQTIRNKLLSGDGESSPATPRNPENFAFIGITLASERPYRVISAEDLVDEVHLKQGQRGYSNPEVQQGDELLHIDGYNVHELEPSELHKILKGPLGSVAVMIFHADLSGKQFVVRAVRHKAHNLEGQGSSWFQRAPSENLEGKDSSRRGSRIHEVDQVRMDPVEEHAQGRFEQVYLLLAVMQYCAQFREQHKKVHFRGF